MRILGVDPGLAKTGYGIIDVDKKGVPSLAESGVVKTDAGIPLPLRLFYISRAIEKIIVNSKPDEACVEELFFTKNVKTAISVAHARGVILEVCAKRKVNIFEYTPTRIKSALVGYGNASKEQVQYMVEQILGLKKLNSDDLSDALACAICHIHSKRIDSFIGKQ